MTEQELETLRAKMRAEASTVFLFAVLESLARISPAGLPSLLGSAKQKQNEYQQIAVRGLPPEYSDLLAGEFQDAFSDLIKQIEKTLADKRQDS